MQVRQTIIDAGGWPSPYARDVISGVLFDRLRIEPGESLEIYDFFRGHDGSCGSYEVTNVYRAHRLAAPEEFLVRQIGVLFSPACDPADRSRFIESYTLRFWFEQKWFADFPLSHAFAVNEKRTDGLPNAPEPIRRYFQLDIPQKIDHQVNFYVTIQGSPINVANPMTMWVELLGDNSRGVQ